MHKHRQVWSSTFGPIIKGFHVHHIVPRCEGGKDTLGNLIALHPDDHHLIHKMRGDKWCGNIIAMRNGHSKETRKKISEAQKGKNNSMYGKEHPKGMLGKTHTAEAKRRIGIASVGDKNPVRNPAWLRTCEHCNKTMNKSHILQWHGDKCKYK